MPQRHSLPPRAKFKALFRAEVNNARKSRYRRKQKHPIRVVRTMLVDVQSDLTLTQDAPEQTNTVSNMSLGVDDENAETNVRPVADNAENTEKNRCRAGVLKRLNTKGPCEHGAKYRSQCKICRTCQHGRNKYQCKECGGPGFCEHGRQRYQCKECGGAGICEHGLQRQLCKDCGGSQICQHGHQRSGCKQCKESEFSSSLCQFISQ